MPVSRTNPSTLHEERSFSGGSFALSDFAHDTEGFTSLTLAIDRVRSSTETHHVARSTTQSFSGADSDANRTGQGAANFTSSQTGTSTYSLRADSQLEHASHAAGTYANGAYSLSSFGSHLETSGTQSSTHQQTESANSSGTNSGTFQLGLNAPFQGSGSFEQQSYESSTATDTRAFTLHVEAAGASASGSLTLSNYGVEATSAAGQRSDQYSESASTITGTRSGSSGGPYSAVSSESVTAHSQQYLESEVIEAGQFTSAGGYNVGVSLSLNGSSSASVTKGSQENYSGSLQGSNNLSATGRDTGAFTFTASGTYAGGSYSFSSFALTGESEGSFTKNETGSHEGTNYSHGARWTGSSAVHQEGEYGGGNYSFSTYSSQCSSSETISDSVGNANNWLNVRSQTTTTGTGQTGVATTTTGQSYAYGGGGGSSFETTTSTTVTLSGPSLEMVPAPSSRVLPSSMMGEGGGGAMMVSNGGLMGTGDEQLPRPPAGALMIVELLGSQSGWVFGLSGTDSGPGLSILAEALEGEGTASLGMLTEGVIAIGGGGVTLWSWLGQGAMSIGGSAGLMSSEGASRAMSAERTMDPLGLEASRRWEESLGRLTWSEWLSVKRSLWDYGRMYLEFRVGTLHVLSGGLSTRLGKALGADRYLNYQSSAYQYGVYAGEAIEIALTLWNPTGVAGKILKAYWAVRAVAGGVEAGVAAWEGRYEDAIFGVLGAVLMLGRGGGKGCGLANLFGGRFRGAGRVLALGMAGYGIYRGAELAGQRFEDGDYLGAALALGQAAADAYALSRTCFTAEMLLDSEHGKKRADAIRVGDRLWSQPEDDPHGPLALKEVEEVFVRVSPVLNVHVAGQIIRTTAEHPFWVEGKGWMPAGALEVGDLLRTRCGMLVAVEGVADSGEVTTVYNWRIADYHTYFVSATEAGVSIWAHNTYVPGKDKAVDKSVRRHQRKLEKRAAAAGHTGRGNQATISGTSTRSKGGKYTEPTLPPKGIVKDGGVTVEHYTKGTDHLPPHAHVYGLGARRNTETRIGANGKPLLGDRPLSKAQQVVVESNLARIRKAINKIKQWWRWNNYFGD